MKFRRALVSAATVGIATASLSAASSPAVAEEAPLSVSHVGIWYEGGGYPSTAFGWDGLSVILDDSSVVAGHTYALTATPQDTALATQSVEFADTEFSEGRAFLKLGDRASMGAGIYDVTVTEFDASGAVVEESAPYPFSLRQVGHPVDPTINVKGSKVRPGSVVKINWNGAYEDGARVTQIIGFADRKKGFLDAKERDFLVCENSFCPNDVTGFPGFKDKTNVTLVDRFRIPKRFAGKTLVIHAHGYTQDDFGVATIPWGIEWDFKVTKPKKA